jgi:hypothetical protein
LWRRQLEAPTLLVRRNASNLHRHVAASFSLHLGERLFGGRKSFMRLDKRGQKMVLYTYARCASSARAKVMRCARILRAGG